MPTRPALSPAIASVAAGVALALCAAADGAAPAGEPAPSAGREGLLTVMTRTPSGPRGRWFVEFQEEINQLPGSAGIAGGSLRGAAEIDCGAAQFKVAKFSLFAGPKLTGAVLMDVSQISDWRSARPGTTMDRVLAAACGKTKIPVEGAQVRAAAALTSGLKAPDLEPPVKPPAAPGSPSPAPTAAGGGFYAQLASVASADAARQAWITLKGAAPGVLDDRLRRLTTATVHGRRVYRVLAGGFGTKAEAQSVCKALARLTARCFVRPSDLS
jgi:cell division septation protein DedD